MKSKILLLFLLFLSLTSNAQVTEKSILDAYKDLSKDYKNQQFKPALGKQGRNFQEV